MSTFFPEPDPASQDAGARGPEDEATEAPPGTGTSSAAPFRLPRSPSGRVPAWVLEEAARAQATGTQPNFGPFAPPPPGGPPGSSGAAGPAGRYHLPGAGERPRRSLWSRLVGIALLVAVGLGAVFVASDLLSTSRVPPELLGSYAERDDLPPPLGLSPASSFPTPGFGEAKTPLARPPEVAEPADAWQFQLRATNDVDGDPVLWSPCRPIHYVVNTDGGPEDFLVRVTDAVEEVSALTGLVFHYDGTTTEPISRNRESFLPLLYGDRWAPVLIGWADEEQHPGLAGSVAGLAHVHASTDRSTGRQHIVSGQVVLDTGMARSWPAGSDWYVGVLRHELGHLVGLDHVDDPRQLMFAQAEASTFQAGDLTGLAAAGLGPCAPGL